MQLSHHNFHAIVRATHVWHSSFKDEEQEKSGQEEPPAFESDAQDSSTGGDKIVGPPAKAQPDAHHEKVYHGSPVSFGELPCITQGSLVVSAVLPLLDVYSDIACMAYFLTCDGDNTNVFMVSFGIHCAAGIIQGVMLNPVLIAPKEHGGFALTPKEGSGLHNLFVATIEPLQAMIGLLGLGALVTTVGIVRSYEAGALGRHMTIAESEETVETLGMVEVIVSGLPQLMLFSSLAAASNSFGGYDYNGGDFSVILSFSSLVSAVLAGVTLWTFEIVTTEIRGKNVDQRIHVSTLTFNGIVTVMLRIVQVVGTVLAQGLFVCAFGGGLGWFPTVAFTTAILFLFAVTPSIQAMGRLDKAGHSKGLWSMIGWIPMILNAVLVGCMMALFRLIDHRDADLLDGSSDPEYQGCERRNQWSIQAIQWCAWSALMLCCCEIISGSYFSTDHISSTDAETMAQSPIVKPTGKATVESEETGDD